MPRPIPFLCNQTKDITLAAGVAQQVDVETNGALWWGILVKNTGANPVTALSTASSPLGTYFEDAAAVTSGIPLAAGGGLMLRGNGEPSTTVRLTLTSTLGTTVTIEAAGR